ncbi:hypothetical protein V6Z12_D08G034600 [Gossypium hirsutum]
MASDGVFTRMQKELASVQQDVSKLQAELGRLEAKLETQMDTKFQEFRNEIRTDLQTLLEQYLGQPKLGPTVSVNEDKGKGVLGAPLGFPAKELGGGSNLVDGTSFHRETTSHILEKSEMVRRHLECPNFDGSDFRGWLTKLEQYFEAEGTLDSDRVRVVMLHLEGRALEWHHFFSQRNGGLNVLTWPSYLKSLQDRFGFGQFGNPMRELVNLKQQGTVEQYQDMFVGLLNQLHLPETYALSIFISNLKAEIGHYLDLFEPLTLMEAFQLARKIEVLIANSGKGYTDLGVSSPRTIPTTSFVSRHSSSATRTPTGTQSSSNASSIKRRSKTISPALMAERKKKGLCFWCGAKYHMGHKCVKSQLYQFLLEPLSEGEADEFQECSEKLEEIGTEEESLKSPIISLHALNGLQGHNTMRVAARVGSCVVVILVDSGSTHNFIDARLVNRLSLPVIHQEKLKVSVANGSHLFTIGLCQGVVWEVQSHKFETNFMVLSLKGCDVVLGVQWLLALGDIIWNFSSLTMQFQINGESCSIQGIVPGALATRTNDSKAFAIMGQSLGPYTAILSSPAQVLLLSMGVDDTEGQLQTLLREFDDVFQVPKGLPPRRVHDHKIPLRDEGVVVKLRPYRHPAFQKTKMERLIQEMLQAGII